MARSLCQFKACGRDHHRGGDAKPALDEAGDGLAFGSTTGGLWVSEDQGERWTCVMHTLPPVYAVRFT